MALLSIRNLTTMFYTEEGIIKACDRFNLNIPPENVGLIGETGCGKSIAGNVILRLLPRNAVINGEIRYKGRNPDHGCRQVAAFKGRRLPSSHRSPSALLESGLKIGFQIAEGLLLHRKIKWEEAWAKAVEMLEFLKLPEPAKRAQEYPHQLSSGMKQRAAAAGITGRRVC